jgi:nicotinate phosphoribosyltransferase
MVFWMECYATEDFRLREKAMLTDLYQLTMGAAYVENEKEDEKATFDYFIRNLPKDWGYFIANGVDDTVEIATKLRFRDDDLEYLKGQKIFNDEFLDYLENFHFKGDIYAMGDGTPFAPGAPVIRVTGNLPEAQILETVLLNTMNYQTMTASKASRVVNAAKGKDVFDFGLRRAHGEDAGMEGAKASFMAGCKGTSNVKAGKKYGIPLSGTMAHSFVMSFPDEKEAFEAYAKAFPDKSTFLIDTYDTKEGAKNAIEVGKKMEEKGHRLAGIRIDSGNLDGLAREIRKMLDENDMDCVKIIVSSDLNEYKIDDLMQNKSPIDGFGVGTEMITSKPIAALSGVYKLVEDGIGPRIKLSEGKETFPGKKQVYRICNEHGKCSYDVLALEQEEQLGIPLLEPFVIGGERIREEKLLDEKRDYCIGCVERLPERAKIMKVAEPYEMKISDGLRELVKELKAVYGKR